MRRKKKGGSDIAAALLDTVARGYEENSKP